MKPDFRPAKVCCFGVLAILLLILFENLAGFAGIIRGIVGTTMPPTVAAALFILTIGFYSMIRAFEQSVRQPQRNGVIGSENRETTPEDSPFPEKVNKT